MDNSKIKRTNQLGMNPATASGRLVKDILFSLIKDRPCFRCGQTMNREDFTIEHKTPWLDSEDPIKLFFDLDNIAFSHYICNIRAGRKPNQKYFSEDEKLEASRAWDKKYRDRLSDEEKKAYRRKRYELYNK